LPANLKKNNLLYLQVPKFQTNMPQFYAQQNRNFFPWAVPIRWRVTSFSAGPKAQEIKGQFKLTIFDRVLSYMDVSPKIGGETPKMDGENNGKTHTRMDDLGGSIIFAINTHILPKI